MTLSNFSIIALKSANFKADNLFFDNLFEWKNTFKISILLHFVLAEALQNSGVASLKIMVDKLGYQG